MLPGLQYALCLSFTRPVLVNRLQQESVFFFFDGLAMAAQPFLLFLSFCLLRLCNTFSNFSSFIPPFLFSFFSLSCQNSVRWENSIPHCHSPNPCGSHDKTVSLSTSDGCSIVQCGFTLGYVYLCVTVRVFCDVKRRLVPYFRLLLDRRTALYAWKSVNIP